MSLNGAIHLGQNRRVDSNSGNGRTSRTTEVALDGRDFDLGILPIMVTFAPVTPLTLIWSPLNWAPPFKLASALPACHPAPNGTVLKQANAGKQICGLDVHHAGGL